MSESGLPLAPSVLRAILQHVVRAEALALEGLALQARVHAGLLGGDAQELAQAAEKRAYARAESLLHQLLPVTPAS
jgi:hypothetical protein